MTEQDKAVQTPNLEQPLDTQDPSNDGTNAPLAKFANEKELAKAYKALEAEFTRRSQKLRELERQEKENRSVEPSEAASWEERVGVLIDKYPIARSLSKEIEEYIRENNNIITQNDCLEYALINVLAASYHEKEQKREMEKSIKDRQETKEQFKSEIIAEYLAALNKDTPKVMPKGGEIPALPPLKCSSIKEAGIYAEKILNS